MIMIIKMIMMMIMIMIMIMHHTVKWERAYPRDNDDSRKLEEGEEEGEKLVSSWLAKLISRTSQLW